MNALTKFLLSMAEGDSVLLKREAEDRWELIVDDGFQRATITIDINGNLIDGVLEN